jgi:hypothetical protein
MLQSLPLAWGWLWIEMSSPMDEHFIKVMAHSLPQNNQQDWRVGREEVIDGLGHDIKSTNNATAITTTCVSLL